MDQVQEQRLRCYMKDCGCSPEQAEEYIRMAASDSRQDQMYFLKRHRNTVMDQMHTAMRQVDCIDYVIHELEQEVKNS